MPTSIIVETIHGKLHKYEIVKTTDFISTTFSIHRDGKRWKGSYDSLARAVEVARAAG
jgi:hypothetical protein